jgi:hypothetical protein
MFRANRTILTVQAVANFITLIDNSGLIVPAYTTSIRIFEENSNFTFYIFNICCLNYYLFNERI